MNMLPSAVVPLAQSSGKISPVLVAVILAVLVILILWLVLRLFSRAAPAARPNVKAATLAEKHPAIPTASPAVKPDDLEIIEGIGPKIAGVLRAAGITTFAQLAVMEPSKISDLIHAGGIRLADPRTWPEQARLAAAGDQAGLQALQDRLKAGREVKI